MRVLRSCDWCLISSDEAGQKLSKYAIFIAEGGKARDPKPTMHCTRLTHTKQNPLESSCGSCALGKNYPEYTASVGGVLQVGQPK